MIYVDQLIFKKLNGRKLYCHLFADSLEELHAFAEKIGRKKCWFHRSKSGYLHYDLDDNFRIAAIENGAIEIQSEDAVTAKNLGKTIQEHLDSKVVKDQL